MTTFDAKPGEEACDFCSERHPTWDYPCETFLLLGGAARSLDEWAACDTCHKFIVAGQWQQLAVRAAMKLGWELELVIHIHAQFKLHRKGVAVPRSL